MFKHNPDTLPSYPGSQNFADGNWQNGSFQNYGFVDDPNYNMYETPFPDGDVTEIPDFPDACLKFINDILMEEDFDDRPASSQDLNALQATEKSLYDALGETYPPSSDQWQSSVGQSAKSLDVFDRSFSSQLGNSCCAANANMVESNWLIEQRNLKAYQVLYGTPHLLESTSQSSSSSSSLYLVKDGSADSPISTLLTKDISLGNSDQLGEACNSMPTFSQVYKVKNHEDAEERGRRKELVDASRGRKNHQRENNGQLEERSNKLLAPNYEEYEEMEKFDDVLICKEGNDDISPCTSKSAASEGDANSEKGNSKGTRRRSKSRGKKKSNKEIVDLRTLLNQCAQAVASLELTNAEELLKQIRQHAKQLGDSVERVAYYFANGLEARLAGTGSDSYRSHAQIQVSSYDILKSYKLYVSAIPFQRTSYFLANQTIVKWVRKATRIHIIDFGIYLGFQWPCLIQSLSRRLQGPPRLRITGVDYPVSGFKPTLKVEETGHRLKGYCGRFGVPFEFHAIAQPWNTLNPKDFKIDKDELLVVTSLYHSGKIPDETVDVNSPRDYFLRLIKSLNPDLFIHGVVNGTFNAPFFTTRFREALYHYSCLFDVFDATVPREEHERHVIESLLYGKSILNIVACEGSERIERPESYKQWQIRQQRAGFKQVLLDQDIFNRARAMVKANYHKDFMVEQDRDWMVQGWKGRIVSSVSCWKPA